MTDYTGLRYTPIYDGEWEDTKAYDNLSIVVSENQMYMSKQPVPAGTVLTNQTYWANVPLTLPPGPQGPMGPQGEAGTGVNWVCKGTKGTDNKPAYNALNGINLRGIMYSDAPTQTYNLNFIGLYTYLLHVWEEMKALLQVNPTNQWEEVSLSIRLFLVWSSGENYAYTGTFQINDITDDYNSLLQFTFPISGPGTGYIIGDAHIQLEYHIPSTGTVQKFKIPVPLVFT